MKKVLMVATVPYMIGQFNMSNIGILQELQYEVHIACNFRDRSSWTEKEVSEFIDVLKERNIVYHQIDFSRSPFNIQKDIVSYKELKKLVKSEKYEFMHCHTPVGGVIGRLVAHEIGIKAIYTAHGFHFYNGAPKKNWMIYYPIEKFLSKWTEVLITINKEDYNRAKEKFYAKRTVYIPGVGVDIKKFSREMSDEEKRRKKASLGLPKDAYVILSVGELNNNKNHLSVIRAISEIEERKNMYYLVAGAGDLREVLENTAKELKVNLLLLGFRTDVAELYHIADLFIHPSKREGMPVAVMEAVASKCLVLGTKIRGTKDLISDKCLFETGNILKLRDLIQRVRMNSCDDLIEENYSRLQEYTCDNVHKCIEIVYKEI
jgi:glycosyltransferase involved in cell wall biosynthesis